MQQLDHETCQGFTGGGVILDVLEVGTKKKVIGNMIAMAQIPISSSSLFFFLANQGGQKTEKYNLQEFRFFFLYMN